MINETDIIGNVSTYGKILFKNNFVTVTMLDDRHIRYKPEFIRVTLEHNGILVSYHIPIDSLLPAINDKRR